MALPITSCQGGGTYGQVQEGACLGPAEHVMAAASGLVEPLWPGAAVKGPYALWGGARGYAVQRPYSIRLMREGIICCAATPDLDCDARRRQS